jgi:hypothetical protein
MPRWAAVLVLAGCARPPAPTTPPAVVPAVAALLADLDRDVDPCKDFYEWSCGGWHERHPDEWRQQTVRSQTAEDDLRALLDEAAAGKPAPSAENAAGWAYLGSWRRACDDWSERPSVVDAVLATEVPAGNASAAIGALSAYGVDPVFDPVLVPGEGGKVRLVLAHPPFKMLLDRRISPSVYKAWDDFGGDEPVGELVPIAGRTGGFDWAAWAAAADLHGLEVVVDATYADRVDAVFAATDPADLWALVGLLGHAWVGEPRTTDACVAGVLSEGTPLLAPHYLARYLPPADREGAAAVVAEVRDVLADEVDRSRGIDAESRALGRQVLDALTIDVGPSEAMPFDAHPLGTGYLGHSMPMARAVRAAMLATMNDEHGSAWTTSPWESNAFYASDEHRMFVNAAAVSRPWYVPGSRVMTMGALGAIMGHEMIHALTVGSPVSDHPEWLAVVGPPFARYGDCLAQDHAAWRKTLATERLPPYAASAEEDVADAVGLHVAWVAWDEGDATSKVERAGASYAPLTSSQIFFAAYGQAMCDSLVITDGRHDVTRVRVNAAVAQEPAFAEAFGCYDGVPEAPTNRCEPLFGR